MSSPFVSDVPEGEKRGWKVLVTDRPGEAEREIAPARIRVVHPAFGELAVGKTRAGYDGWAFYENGGGGSVIVPFVRVWREDSKRVELLVGVVQQMRPNQSAEPVYNVPRGFLDPGESHFQAAMREGEEELGLSRDVVELFELDGQPGNPNSTFFVTDGSGEGVHFYGMKVAAFFLNPAAGEDRSHTFLPGVIRARPQKKATDFASEADFRQWEVKRRLEELILGARFIPVNDALTLGDLFTVSGAGRLIGHLAKFGPTAKPALVSR